MAGQHWRLHVRDKRSESYDSIPASIGAPATSVTVTGLATATQSAFTSVVSTFSLPGGSTNVVTIPITDSLEYASLTSQAAQRATATESPSTTRADVAATSSQAAANSASNNLHTLIPAIVAPVAVVLIVSFVAFWLLMRRRAIRAIKSEPEFVMEGMKEKPRSRPVTADSNSSTQKLVSSKNKEAMIDIKEVDRPSLDLFPPGKIADTNDHRPRADSVASDRTDSRQQDQDPAGRSKAIPNFSRGPRPGTAGRDTTASPAPSFSQRDRNQDRFGPRSPQSAARPDNGPPGAGRNGSSGTPQNPRPRGPPPGTRGPPASVNTANSHVPRQSVSSPPAPPGAYNGASPISQYSPIVKDVPKFGTSPMAARQHAEAKAAASASENDQATPGVRKPPPSAIKTNTPLGSQDPTFSRENMEIARLANNSRLGFSATTSPTVATEEPPTPSPRLPPPATRDAPPTNYNIPIPTHEPAAPASIQSRLNGVSVTDRRSVVSGLSDDYVDMEVDDNKSDVSSLDEREKWQMENEREASQHGGLGAYGAGAGSLRPPLLSSPNPESGFSEASGSQYSLGKY